MTTTHFTIAKLHSPNAPGPGPAQRMNVIAPTPRGIENVRTPDCFIVTTGEENPYAPCGAWEAIR